MQSPGDALQPEAPPPPPPSSPRKRRPIIATASGVLSFLGIAAVAAIALFSLGLQRIHAPGPLQADKVVYIESGTDSTSIVDQLEREGVIDSWPLMTAALYLKREHKPIKAGEYLFKQNASLGDVVDILISGKQVLHSITIPEGLTSEQIVQRLQDNDVLVGSVNAPPPEGSLMPDTFKFARGTSRETLIRTMQAEQKRIMAEVWAHRAPDTPIKSPFEMLTLASIVEKETGRADERPRVAGVFVNRLIRNMPLQSDPTIVYGLVGGKGTLGRGILRSELDQRTPYNTYMVTGLPPGPICNPGPGRHGGRRQSVPHQGDLFRGRRDRRPCLCRDAGPASSRTSSAGGRSKRTPRTRLLPMPTRCSSRHRRAASRQSRISAAR